VDRLRRVPAAAQVEPRAADVARAEHGGGAGRCRVRPLRILEEVLDLQDVVPLRGATGAWERVRAHGCIVAAEAQRTMRCIAYAAAPERMTPSMRSSTPPCPGSHELMSLTPRS